jgi:hypothetical protein
MSRELTTQLLNEIIAAFNNHDAETIASYFSHDGVMLGPAGKEPEGTNLRGPEAIKASLQKRFADSPDIQWTDGKSWIFGNKALSEWRVRGTAPDGTAIDAMGCDLWEFEGGKIAKKDIYYKQRT